MARRRRATSAAAAAPNRMIIGGAGTGVPPFEPPLELGGCGCPPLLLEPLEVDELVEDEVLL